MNKIDLAEKRGIRMNYYKAKFLKDNQPQGRPYTYAFNGELSAGDKVELPNGKHGVVEGAADMEEVEKFGVDRIKGIVGKYVEPAVAGESEE